MLLPISGYGASIPVQHSALIPYLSFLIKRILPALPDTLSERHQRKLDHLKMLPAERDANDGNAQKNTEKDMIDRDPNSTTEDPDNIQDKGQTAHIVAAAIYLCTKWPEHHHCQLKTLKPERNTNNSAAQYDTSNKITDGAKQPATYEPDNITQ